MWIVVEGWGFIDEIEEDELGMATITTHLISVDRLVVA